jgi:hypothetical protein
LTQVSEQQMMQEIKGSIIDLEKKGLPRPKLFAYPYGLYNQKIQTQVEGVGFEAAFAIDPGLVNQGENPYQIPRFEIRRQDVGFKFLKKVLWTH